MWKNSHNFTKAALGAFIGLAIMAAMPVSAAHRNVRSYRQTGANAVTSWSGTVVSVYGSSLTFNSGNGQTYTVNAGSATVVMKDGSALPVSNIEVNDRLTIAGTLQGSAISATSVTDNSLRRFVTISGTITSVSGNTFTLLMDQQGSATVHLVSGGIRDTNGNGSAANYSASNERVRATGTWDEANNALWTTDVRFMNGRSNRTNSANYSSNFGNYGNYSPNATSAAENCPAPPWNTAFTSTGLKVTSGAQNTPVARTVRSAPRRCR